MATLMKCQECNNEATVHETTIVKGAKVERHLCEACASKIGLGIHGPQPPGVSGFSLQPGVVTPSTPKQATACGHCGMTFAEFKQHGQVGCSGCYEVFESQLLPLIERAHEGSESHVGKTPRATVPERSGGLSMQERYERMRALQRELDTAVASEQYELAAKLRDELRRLADVSARPGGSAVAES